MTKKYYVKGKEIDLDYWAIDFGILIYTENGDIDELDDESIEHVTDRHGKILGVAWEMEL
tara:strand:- start:146 stop:325 length:180 start_codon:yes stop_codon:yes gene_type:complete